MAKIMLVEDDNNLREIYEARLLAEGYEIVSAHDGEEALTLAVREKPDLIISDVMMPKISGFDMLDILRNTPETKYTKVIMMTALSQAEDKDRADKLGADRYLVKSQVTLEDVARVAREVLDGKEDPLTAAPAPAITAPPSEPAPGIAPAADSAPEPAPAAAPKPAEDAPSPDSADEKPEPDSEPTPAGSGTKPAIAGPEAEAPAEDATEEEMPAAPLPETTPAPGSEPAAKDEEDKEETPDEEPADEAAVPAAAVAAAVTEPGAGTAPAEEPSTEEAKPGLELPTPAEQLDKAPTTETEQHTVENQIEEFLKNNAIEPDGTSPPAAAAEKKDLILPSNETDQPEAAAGPVAGAPEVGTDADSGDSSLTAPHPVDASDGPAAKPDEIAEPPKQQDDKLESADYPDNGVSGKKVIQPINDPTVKPDLNALLAKEAEKEEVAHILGAAGAAAPAPQTPAPDQQAYPDGQDPNLIAL